MAQTGNAAHKLCDSLRLGLLILFRSARFALVQLGSVSLKLAVWVCGVQRVGSAADLQALKPFVELNRNQSWQHATHIDFASCMKQWMRKDDELQEYRDDCMGI